MKNWPHHSPAGEETGRGEKGIDFPSFLASVAHDMKNSLGMLLSTLDEVIGSCGPETCPSYDRLSLLQYEAKRVSSNLIQLLTLYKIDNAQYSVDIEYHPVADFLEEIILHHKPLFDFKKIAVELDCPPDLSRFFDRDLIAGVMNNVINNTFRYTKDRICVSAAEAEGHLVIAVEDNGAGYPAHMLESGVTAARRSDFGTGSTGLGLFFASLAAALHRNKGREGYILTTNGGRFGGGRFQIFLP